MKKYYAHRTSILNYKINNAGLVADINMILEMIDSAEKGNYLACANPHSLVVAEKDRFFKTALNQSDILIPDGSGIILAANILNKPIKEKVSGSDIFFELSMKLNKKGGYTYFFLGASEIVLEKIRLRMEHEFSSISVVGTFSPPFKPEFNKDDNIEMIKAINKAKPDVLWVGMTAPKQEKWINENRKKLDVNFIGAIGAVFDFYAGTKKRSSKFWIKLGLEWLPRFIKEPKRLWERNIKSTPIFLWMLFNEKYFK